MRFFPCLLNYWCIVSLPVALCDVFYEQLFYQMFKIFKSSVLVSHRFNSTTSGKCIMYVFCTSLTFVVTGLTISFLLSRVENSGYGGSICDLLDYLMHSLMFIIPTALTIIVNIGLFGYIVFVLNKTTHDAAMLQQERNYFGVYIRLSTLTSYMDIWLSSPFIQLDVIEYFFIVFNSLQGVFIMPAFVGKTKHHSDFCQQLRPSRTSGTTSQTNTIKRLEAEVAS